MTDQVQTFNGLTQAIITWTNRNDQTFVDNIPIFISLVEQEIFTKLSTLGNEIYIRGTFNPNNPYVPKPALWGKTARFTFIDSTNKLNVLERISTSYQYFYNPSLDPSANSPLPRYYSDKSAAYFYISATPTEAFNFEIGYFQKFPPLSSSNQTNGNTLYRYDMLFKGCLAKSFAFVNATDTATFWKGEFQESIDTYTAYDKDRLADATTNVDME